MNKFALLLCSLFLTTLAGATFQTGSSRSRRLGAATSAQAAVTQQSSQFRNTLPRKNFKFQDVSPNFDPASKNYREAIIMISGYGVVPAAVVILFMLIATCCGLLKTCGSLCDKNEEKESSFCGRLVVYALFFACGIAICVALGFGAVGSGNLGKMILRVEKDVVQAALNLNSEATAVNNSLTEVRRSSNSSLASVDAEWAKAQHVINGFTSVVTNNQVSLDKLEKTRVAIYTGFATVMALTLVGGIYLAVTGHVTLLLAVIFLAALSSSLMFVSFGGHLALSVLLSDACLAAESLVRTTNANQLPTPSSAGLANYLSCPSNVTIHAVLVPVNAQLYQTTVNLNAAIKPSNPKAYAIMTNGTSTLNTAPMPCFCPCSGISGQQAQCNEAQCNSYLNSRGGNTSAVCYRAVLSGQVGAGGLVRPLVLQLNSSAEAPVMQLASGLLNLNISRGVLLRVRDCSFITAPLQAIVADSCSGGMRSLDFLWSSSLVLALFLGVFAVTLLMGRHHFAREDGPVVPRSKYYQRHPSKYGGNGGKKKGGKWGKKSSKDDQKKKQRELYYDIKL